MNFRTAFAPTLGVAVLCSVAAVAFGAGSPPPATQASVTIQGSPGDGMIPFNPLTLTMSDLADPAQFPQTTVTLEGGTVEKGPLVSAVLAKAGLVFLPTGRGATACNNDELRFWAEASSLDGSASEITPGELDTGFGNRPAILSVSENGNPLSAPRLAIPDSPNLPENNIARDIPAVFNLTVGRAAPQLTETGQPVCNPSGFIPPVTTLPAPGSVLITGDVVNPGTVVTLQQLQAMTQHTQTDTFLSGASPSTKVETGPTLYDVIGAAGGPALGSGSEEKLRFYVNGTSSQDGVHAVVSWAEFDPSLDANQMLLSLLEGTTPANQVPTTAFGPRLTTPGDVKGGRYISGIQVLDVVRAPDVAAPAAGSGPDLDGRNFNGTSLAGAYLVGASLRGSNLNKGSLAGTLLVNADLAGANLNGADLRGALLSGADLRGANLNKADLTGANLSGADLNGANLHGAVLTGTVFSNTTCPNGSNSDAEGGTCKP